MSYDKDVVRSVFEILQQKRNNAIRLAESRKSEIYSKDKRFSEIDCALSTLSLSAAKLALGTKKNKDELVKLKEKSQLLQNEYNLLLSKYGYSKSSLEPNYSCSRCKDTGYIELEDRTILCNCFEKLVNEEMSRRLNESSPLKLSTFDSFSLDYYRNQSFGGKDAYDRMYKIFNYCIDYAKNFSLNSKSLFLQGSTGLGKTHLSLAIANEVLKKGYNVIYVTASDICTKLEKEHYSFDYKDEGKTFNSLVNCDLLILDDLGTEFITKNSSNTMYNIFNSRILKSVPIIISTNITMEEVQQNYSQRFVSRVMGYCDRLEFIGRDVRSIK